MNGLKRNAAEGISTNDRSSLCGNGTFPGFRVYYKRWMLQMIEFSNLPAILYRRQNQDRKYDFTSNHTRNQDQKGALDPYNAYQPFYLI